MGNLGKTNNECSTDADARSNLDDRHEKWLK
jgi:hypothetical protein